MFIDEVYSTSSKKQKKNTNINISKSDIEKTLNEEILDYKLWLENRNSKIYKVFTNNDETLILKLCENLTTNELKYEYEQYKRLNTLKNEYVNIPKTYGINYKMKYYIMDFIEGHTISELINRMADIQQLSKSCLFAGKLLGQLHNYWESQTDTYENLNYVFEDIENSLIKFSKRELEILHFVKCYFKEYQFAYKQVYRDYDALNILVNENQITLIDLPENPIKSLVFWDIATFTFSLKKASMKSFIFFKRKSKIKLLEDNFLEGYFLENQSIILNTKEFNVILLLFEIQRIIQLMHFQKKHQQNNAIFTRKKIYSTIAIILLKKEMKKNFKQIENEINKMNGE